MLPLSYVCRQSFALLARTKDITFLVISTHLLMNNYIKPSEKNINTSLSIKNNYSIYNNNNKITVKELERIKKIRITRLQYMSVVRTSSSKFRRIMSAIGTIRFKALKNSSATSSKAM